MGRLSFYKLTILDDCSRCFWYMENGKKRPRGPFSQLANRFERILLESFEDQREEGQLPQGFEGLDGYQLLQDPEMRYFKNKGLVHKDPRGFNLLARPDEVLVKDDRYLIADYKTKSSARENNPQSKLEENIREYRYGVQASFYNYVFAKQGYQVEDRGLLLFYFMDNVEDGKIAISSKQVYVPIDHDDIEARLDKAALILESDKPPQDNCDWCVGPEYR